MDEEKPVEVLIMLDHERTPWVAASEPVHVRVADQKGRIYLDFEAQDFATLAAQQLAALAAPKVG